MKIKILLLWLIMSVSFFAQNKTNNSTWVDVDKFTVIKAPSIFTDRNILNKTATSNFEVIESDDYGLSIEVRAALDHAIELWSYMLNTTTSDQTIKIFVEYKDLGNSETIAQCGSKSFYNSSSLPIPSINYPIALAEDLLNQNLNGTDYEIELTINSNDDITFYTGIDGIPQSGEIDLVTILLHELAHGFGYSGTMYMQNSIGYWGNVPLPNGQTSLYADIYGYYCAIGSSVPANDKLINYASGSASLTSKLKSDNVFFSGPKTKDVYGANYPKLFAPTTWKAGSSIAHLDDGVFENTNNALMIHGRSSAEVVHSPGVIGLSILEDLGWKVNRLATIDAPKNGEILTKGHTYDIKWSDNEGSNADMVLYKVGASDILTPIGVITSVSGLGNEKTFGWTIPSALVEGDYRIKIENGGVAYEISSKFQISNSSMASLPIINPASGEYTKNTLVNIDCVTEGSEIYYTTNGNTPTVNSEHYVDPFSVNPPVTVKAIAVKSGILQSNMASETYTLTLGWASVIQKDKDNNKFGHAYIWSLYSQWVKMSRDKAKITSSLYLRADTTFIPNTTQKFKLWHENVYGINEARFINHYEAETANGTNEIIAQFDEAHNINLRINAENSTTIASGTSFEMKDPWFRDYVDGNKGLKNRSTPILHSAPADVTTSTNFKGVFLGQGYNPVNHVWSLPYYSVKTTSPQTINAQGKDRQFYFQNWESSGATFQNSNSLETPVVFNQANATVKAVMKGIGLSNNSAAFNNNQRKIVRTGNNYLHMVYESMGKIWYERSTNNGSTWTIMNGGAPISDNEAKSPSIESVGYNILIVFQQNNGGQSTVEMVYLNGSGVITQNISVVPNSTISYASNNLSPVVELNSHDVTSCVMVVWSCPEANGWYFANTGLYYRIATETNDIYSWANENSLIPNTNSSSINPTLTSTNDHTTPYDFHLAWQQNGSGSSIKYRKMVWNETTKVMAYPYYSEPSSTSGYSSNFNPSIAITLNRPRVVWLTEHPITYIKEGNLRTGNFATWGTLTRFSYGGGDDVESINVNARNIAYGFVVGYAGTGNEVRYFKADNTNQAAVPTRYDNYVQISNGTDYTDMAIETFNTSATPYYFNSTTVDATLAKTSLKNNVIIGREIILTKGKSTLIFEVNNINVDDNIIEFIEVEDTLIAKSRNEKISLFETTEFFLTDNSNFTFDANYFLSDKENLKDHFNFEFQLVDVLTNKAIGVLQKIETSKILADEVNSVSYSIDTKGIGSERVKLKLVVDKDIADNIEIATTYTTSGGLGKESSKTIAFNELLAITDYALSQNYPNPFNPSTQISYQIPNDGFVTFKIYDITGQEVKTLVNQAQSKGRYEINFDASNLSSGVYFYRLNSGSFTKSMKMLLLK